MNQSDHIEHNLVQPKESLSHACRATEDIGSWWRVLTELWSIAKGNGKPVQDYCLENPINNMKK